MPLKAPREGHLRGEPLAVAEVGVLCVGPISQEEEVPLRTLYLFALEANERQRVVLCLCEDLLFCCPLLWVEGRPQADSVEDLCEGQQRGRQCRGPSDSAANKSR